MGLWAKLAGAAVGVAGLATGNPALIGAGASIIGQDVTAEGAKKAAQQQMDAAEKARTDANTRYDATREEQRAIYNQSNAAFQPFIGLGQGALPNLGSMVGLSQSAVPSTMNATPQAPDSAAPADAAAPTGVQAMTQSPAAARAELRSTGAYGKREGLNLGQLGGLVLLQSPDGSERRLLTRAKADEAMARGAVEVE